MKPNYVYLEFPGDLESVAKRVIAYLFTTEVFHKPGNWMGPVPREGLWQAAPEIKSWLDGLNLAVENVAVLGYYQSSGIHIDVNPRPRINFPLHNYIGTAVTNFYELANLQKTSKKDGGVEYWDLAYDYATIIDSYELTQPVLFDPRIPHSVVFNKVLDNKNPRLALSIFFVDPPYNLLA